MRVRVRVATLDDVDAIVGLNTVVPDLHHRQLPDRSKPPDPAAFAATVRAWLPEDGTTWLIAEAEDV